MDKLKYFIVLATGIILLTFLVSCQRRKTSGIDSKIVYTDLNLLSKILDFSIYKPDSVLFKYKPVINSIEGKQPFFLPAPKDYILEAVLYFKPTTIVKIKKNSKPANFSETDVSKNYSFEWLPESITHILKHTVITKEYAASIFFNKGASQMIFLNDQIILYAYTN